MNGFRQSVTKATQCTPNDCKCDEQRSMHQCRASQIIITSLSMRAIAGNVDSTPKRCSSVGPQVAFSKLEQGNRCLLSFLEYYCGVANRARGAGTFFAGSSSCLYTQRSSSPTELSSQESVGCVRMSHVTRDIRPASALQRTRRLHRASSAQEAGRPIVRRQPHGLFLPRRG